MSHSLGPWHANTPADEKYAAGSTIRDIEGNIVAVVHEARGNTKGNAALIAAAPGLLGACMATLEDLRGMHEPGDTTWMVKARARLNEAIAVATPQWGVFDRTDMKCKRCGTTINKNDIADNEGMCCECYDRHLDVLDALEIE